MHGSSEFSSLRCNDFSDKELIRKQENKAHGRKSKKNFNLFSIFVEIDNSKLK